MKTLRVVTLGILIWSLSLLWPDLSRFLTLPVMTGLLVGLGAGELIYQLRRRAGPRPRNKGRGTGPDHSTRPLPVGSRL